MESKLSYLLFLGDYLKRHIWLKALVLFAVILFSFHASALVRGDVAGEWHLNENAGTNAPDTSPAGAFDGTLNNMEDADWVSAKLNNGLVFDGVDEFVDLNGAGDFERTDVFSLELWFKTTTSAEESILTKQNSAGNLRGWTVFTESGRIKASLVNATTSDEIRIQTDSNSLNDGVFHHIVVTYDGSSDASGLIIYIDGLAVATTTLANTLTGSITNATAMQISGRNGINLVFNGTVDEVVIYDINLSAADVNDTFNNGIGTEFHPPVASVTVDIIHPDGGESFNNVIISTIDINFNVQSPDTNLLFIDLNFSTSSTEGTGTVIIQDINTDSALITCADADFTDTTLCTFSWNIDAVADDNYFILVNVTDEFSTASDFNVSDAVFEIFTPIVEAECVIDLEVSLYLGQYLQINYSGFDDSGTFILTGTFNLFRDKKLLIENEPLLLVNNDFLTFISPKKINDDPYTIIVRSGNCISSETIQTKFS